MSEDLNDLFPDQPKEPDREGSPPEFTPDDEQELEQILQAEMLEEMSGDFEQMIRDVANKWAFEILLTLINPTPESKKKIVDGCIEIAAKRVKEMMEERGQDMEQSEVERMIADVNRAFGDAQGRFRVDYDEEIMDDAFLERCRKAVRRNLSR